MKIGLLSDIHGDVEHLNQALHLLDSHRVDQILCCGDLVDGSDSEIDAVVAALSVRGIPCVLGNHDELPQGQIDDLAPETVRYLQQLPRILRYEFAGKSLALCHATPWSNDIHVFSYSSHQLQQKVAIQGRADCVIFGHTHEPMRLFTSKAWLLNPGSVHLNRFERTHSCAILSLPDFEYTVYDIVTGLPQRIPDIT